MVMLDPGDGDNMEGVGIAQWLECQACDRNVMGLKSGGIIFFSSVGFLC